MEWTAELYERIRPLLPTQRGNVEIDNLTFLQEDISKDTLVITDDPVAPAFLLVLNATISTRNKKEKTE